MIWEQSAYPLLKLLLCILAFALEKRPSLRMHFPSSADPRGALDCLVD